MVVRATSVAHRVKNLRRKLAVTQEDFSRLLGLSYQTVNRWENDQSAPSGLANSLLSCLEKITAAGQGAELIAEFRSGALGAGSPKAYHRIFALAFGMKSGETVPPRT